MISTSRLYQDKEFIQFFFPFYPLLEIYLKIYFASVIINTPKSNNSEARKKSVASDET